MSYNYVYYKDEETTCNAASEILEHSLTCNRMKSTRKELNMVSDLLPLQFMDCNQTFR